MPLALTDYRTSVGRALGSVVDVATWSNDLLDESLRSALQEFTERGPTVEATLLAYPAFEQDVSGLPDIYSVEQVAWPWENDVDDPVDWAVPFRVTGDLLIWLETSTYPATNDPIRVIYRKLWYIQNLDSAASTTVPDRHARVITALGAYYACLLRLRQLSENPKLTSTQTDETITATPGGDKTTTVTSGDQTVTVTRNDDSTTTVADDRTVTTSANNNQFPPIPAQTVTTDDAAATTVAASSSVSTVTDVPTVVTVEDMPTMETSRSTIVEENLHTAAIEALERAMAHFRALADERLARIGTSLGSFANPFWSGIGL